MLPVYAIPTSLPVEDISSFTLMDICTYIIDQPHSKEVVAEVVAYIGRDPQRMDELMQGFMTGSYRLAQRAAWTIRKIGDTHPDMVQPYISDLIPLLQAEVHDAIPRNILALFAQWELPEDTWGPLWDLCFEWLNNPQKPIAIRVHAMTVLGNIASHYPELAGELHMVIESHMPEGSAGFQSRGRKILKKLDKILA
ncbi:MAG: hypothetical protein AAF135_16080 [Bacteroidota bacterium]